MKSCIISLATGDKRFAEGLGRLQESAKRAGFAGEFLFWRPGNLPEGCPPHLDVPYGFKAYCFREARARGMDLVLWLDSSCVVIRKVDPLFRAMTEQGYVLFRNGKQMVGQWASDQAIELFGMSREQAMLIPEINAAAIGLNLNNRVALAFFERWYDAAKDGVAFRGTREPLTQEDWNAMLRNTGERASADPRVRGHRADQTVAGILAHQLGMKLTTSGVRPYSPLRKRIIRPSTLIAIDRTVGQMEIKLTSIGQIRRDRYIGLLTQAGTVLRRIWRLASR